MRHAYTFASLFSGCGGFDLGFVQRGFTGIAAFDNDAVAISNHDLNLGFPTFVEDLSSGEISNEQIRHVDVLLAGAPCQGFSIAGKRDINDPRNALLLAAGRIAQRIRPLVFVAENVSGVLAKPHSRYWDKLVWLFRSIGYQTTTLKCQAQELGMAQMRTRVVLLAWRTRCNSHFELSIKPPSTLRTVLKRVRSCTDHNPILLAANSDIGRISKRIAPGQKLCNVRASSRSVHTWDISEVFGPTTTQEREVLEAILRLRRRERIRDFGDADPVCLSSVVKFLGRPVEREIGSLLEKGFVRRKGKRFDLVHTFNGKFRRLSWDEPSLAVDTRFGDPRYFLHPDENRGFTVREAARIQGFPDSFVFTGSERQKYKMIGNAVPPPMAMALAEIVKTVLSC